MLDGTTSPDRDHPKRKPRATEPPRMEPLATLPVFLNLHGRRAVLAGTGLAAAWKAELLAAAGALVDVYTPEPCDELIRLVEKGEQGGGLIDLHRRAWQPADLVRTAVAIGAMTDDDEGARFAAAARAAGVPVNVIDRPQHCDFQLGTIVNRSPLVIGISTDGAAPILAQAIRSEIEALLPLGIRRWVEAAKRWRIRLRQSGVDSGGRRSFWQRFTDLARREPERVPSEDDFADLMTKSSLPSRGNGHAPGHVSLVGAGPGNPELMTLAAVRALRSADVILYDDLVAPDCLEFARREAKRIQVGKTGHRPSCRQDDINAQMITLAKSGQRVVRLKSGDPMIFGRAREEIDALRRAGVPVSIVSGVTAAQAAAASLQVSLTEREMARRVQFVTGHAREGRLPDDIDWQALADPRATTAAYMPLGTLRELLTGLLESSVEPTRPAAAVFSASRPEEQIIVGTVADLADRVADWQAQPRAKPQPCLVLIGEVVSAARCPEGHAARTGSSRFAALA